MHLIDITNTKYEYVHRQSIT